MIANQMYKIKVKYCHSIHYFFDSDFNAFLKIFWSQNVIKQNTLPGLDIQSPSPFDVDPGTGSSVTVSSSSSTVGVMQGEANLGVAID